MANRIKIRHGNSIPTTSSLLPYELGWNTVNKILYINDNNNAIEGIGLRYINTTDNTTWTADTLGATTSIAFTRNNITGAHATGHIVWLNANDIGTPFQLVVHDSSELYFWKRWKSSGTWTSWTKMNAGYADSAGSATSANALNFVHTNELILGNNTSQSRVWFNYRRVQNGATSGNTAITEYRFGNGNAGTTGVTLYADSFTGAAAYLTTPNTAGFKTDQYGNFQHQSTTTTDYWTIKSNAGTEKFKVNFENGDTNINGTIYITPSLGNYREGIRIKPYDSWATIVLGGNDLSADSGTSANTWSIHNSNGSFYITRNGSSTGTAQLACVSNKWSVSGNITSPSASCSWISGQNATNAAFNVGDATNTGSYWPWMRQTNTSSAKWFSFGTLNTSFYWIGSATSRTENSYDHGMNFDIATGKLLVDGVAVIRDSGTTARRIFVAAAGTTTPPSGAVNNDIVLVKAS